MTCRGNAGFGGGPVGSACVAVEFKFPAMNPGGGFEKSVSIACTTGEFLGRKLYRVFEFPGSTSRFGDESDDVVPVFTFINGCEFLLSDVYANGQDDQNLVQVGGRVVLHVGT